MELPVSFSEKLTALIGADGYEEYARALTQPAAHGLRANRLKLPPPRLAELLNGSVRLGAQVPWCEDGFYFDTDPERMPGRLAYYLAGLYYSQDPSAMYPAATAGIRPGQRVLDLCAAPGGKSLRAASDLGGAGLLVSNDISASRAGTLLYNLELGGVPNVIVTNSTPAELEARFGAFFDVVLVDAPCSGEGMFRKDPEALASWEKYKTDKCVEMQRGILASAAGLVRPGGRIMYSTCTFDRREDEGMMEEFLTAHPEFTLLPLDKPGGVADGIPGVPGSGADALPIAAERCARLWPHRLAGEGQFAALLQKGSGSGVCDGGQTPSSKNKPRSYRRLKEYPTELRAFADANLNELPFAGAAFCVMGESLYACTFEPPDIDRLKVLRMGVLVGELSYGKLRPAQHFIMSLKPEAFRRKLELDPFGPDVKRYLRCESLSVPGLEDGFTAVCVNGFQLGAGEVRGGTMKNLYPKGWRRVI